MIATQIKPTTLNLDKISRSVNLTTRQIKITNNSLINVDKGIKKNTLNTNKLLNQKKDFTKKQIEFEKHQEQEAELEISDISNETPEPTKKSLQPGPSENLFSKLLGFFGYISAGWLLKNLPTWMSIAKEFIGRFEKGRYYLSLFYYNLWNDDESGLIQNFTKTIESIVTNVISFNFEDIPKELENNIKLLRENIDDFGKSFKESLDVISSPLESLQNLQQDLSSEVQDEGAYTSGYTSTMEGKVLSTGAKATYYDPALGGINASGAKTRDGLAATATGEGYRPNVFSAAAFPELIALLPNEYKRPSAGFPGGKTLAKPIHLIVTDSKTGKSAIIRVNDVGSGVSGHAKNHMLDLSVAAKNYFGASNIGSGLEIKMAPKDSRPGPLSTDTVREVTSISPSGIPSGQTVELKGFSVENPQGQKVRGYSGLTPHHTYQRTSDGREVRDFTIFKGSQYINAPVPSPVSGKVTWTGYLDGGGNWVEIMSNAGKVELGHFNKILVKAGQQITTGTILGLQGSTGRSSGPHVHIQAPSSVIRTYIDGLVGGSIVGKSSSTSEVPEKITPERQSVDIVIPETPTSQQSMERSYGGGNKQTIIRLPEVNEYIVLNRFIKNKLLLDLAYN